MAGCRQFLRITTSPVNHTSRMAKYRHVAIYSTCSCCMAFLPRHESMSNIGTSPNLFLYIINEMAEYRNVGMSPNNGIAPSRRSYYKSFIPNGRKRYLHQLGARPFLIGGWKRYLRRNFYIATQYNYCALGFRELKRYCENVYFHL